MWYAQVTNQEVEYCSISRDTTDSDLKQRREIADGTALYVDQVSEACGAGYGQWAGVWGWVANV